MTIQQRDSIFAEYSYHIVPEEIDMYRHIYEPKRESVLSTTYLVTKITESFAHRFTLARGESVQEAIDDYLDQCMNADGHSFQFDTEEELRTILKCLI